ncbi:uncharacterized protein BJ212DRAFT_1304856 [Suillus subaureus]|uniref:HAT C-terminal dimerisation domain-containing protein n=1 Tax=Suillus subaureus TaxID=48587 RepID=A0A9P7J4A3_9AGAM|nr:uncharacterized protein BJ212DRAFT_1304856 [Suillus subaureus]KAG1802384.1 hypothetical protein BJ212DRAFT_1304856 [Suillus subaureus]
MDDVGYNSDTSIVVSSTNIFDHIPALAPPVNSDLQDELDCYLSTDVEHVDNALAWWNEYYLTIPATSVDVEWLFSCGHLPLSHVCSQLSAQTIYWSQLGLVKTEDVQSIAALADVQGDEMLMEDEWDAIVLDFYVRPAAPTFAMDENKGKKLKSGYIKCGLTPEVVGAYLAGD